MVKKLKALKLTPWWKRLISYLIDQIFLNILLLVFLTALYGDELTMILQNIQDIGALNLFQQQNIETAIPLEELKNMTIEQQNVSYLTYIILSRYSGSIGLLSLIVSSLYFGILWWGTGQTIGAHILNIRVISLDGLKNNPLSILLRVIALKIIELGWSIPILIILNPTFKQRLHDFISRTVVVEDFDIEDLEENEEELEPKPCPESDC